jgi:hypothetical protein
MAMATSMVASLPPSNALLRSPGLAYAAFPALGLIGRSNFVVVKRAAFPIDPARILLPRI